MLSSRNSINQLTKIVFIYVYGFSKLNLHKIYYLFTIYYVKKVNIVNLGLHP